MAIRSFQRSIRFTEREWDAVIEAAEKAKLSPGAFVRRAAARAAEDDLGLDGRGLTPELAELIKRTFRGVHLLAYLKREELIELGRENELDGAAEAAKIAQAETLGSRETEPE